MKLFGRRGSRDQPALRSSFMCGCSAADMRHRALPVPLRRPPAPLPRAASESLSLSESGPSEHRRRRVYLQRLTASPSRPGPARAGLVHPRIRMRERTPRVDSHSPQRCRGGGGQVDRDSKAELEVRAPGGPTASARIDNHTPHALLAAAEPELTRAHASLPPASSRRAARPDQWCGGRQRKHS